METKEICDGILHDAHSILDKAEKLIAENHRLEQRNKELTDALAAAMVVSYENHWEEYDPSDENKRPLDGELVVVQVGNCQPYMLTYLKGCKVQINKWFRLPE